MEYKDISVTQLVRDVQRKRIGIPEFQRHFEWDESDRLEMIRTLLRGWPSGAVLMLKAGETLNRLAVTGLEGGPPIEIEDKEGVKLLVLDGQQRITSVYRALTNSDDKRVYFVDIGKLDPGNEFDDEAVESMPRKDWPSDHESAADLRVRVDQLYSEHKWEEWLAHLPTDAKRSRAEAVFETHLEQVRLYQFPALMLEDDLSLGALVRVFSKLNRQGEPLSTFDLLVALMLPHDSFRLRDKEKEAIALCADYVSGFGGTGIGLDIIKTIALLERAEQLDAGDEHPVQGIEEEHLIDMVEQRPKAIIDKWDEAVGFYSEALELLATKCGSVRKNLLPPTGMIISLAAALGAPKPRAGWKKDLERWVWLCWFDQSYGRGVNSRARIDLEELRAWSKSAKAKPFALRELEATPDKVAFGLRGERRSNGLLARGLMALLVSEGVKDWYASADGVEQMLRNWTKPIDMHHIYPEQFLADHKVEDKLHLDTVINFTPLKASTNQSLRSDPPSAVVSSKRIDKSAFHGHFIPYEEFAKDMEGFEAVLEFRTKHILDLIAARTGVKAIADS